MSKGNIDDAYLDAVMKLRHAAFALAGSSNSLLINDREMAESHLKRMALRFAEIHHQRILKPDGDANEEKE